MSYKEQELLASVDKELDTIVWSNGIDLAPEFIFFQAFKDERNLQLQFKAWGYII